jgi:CBS-domain-containing membrane protein
MRSGTGTPMPHDDNDAGPDRATQAPEWRRGPMHTAVYNPTFAALAAGDTVADAAARMLSDRVTDLPVVDAAGKLVGMFRLERLFGMLLPKAALLGDGVPDLAFVSDTLEELRERMRDIDDKPVGELVVRPDHVVHPETSPLEIVLLLYKGANNVPVVEPASGRLVGMISARDVLEAVQTVGSE